MDTLRIEAAREKLPEVMTFLRGHLPEKGLSSHTKMQLLIAVEEIFVNIASYAYPDSTGAAEIKLDYSPELHKMRLTFTDEGIPYNPMETPEPDVTLPAAERTPGGLGIFLVKKVMNEMHYEYTGGKNCLTLTKQLDET